MESPHQATDIDFEVGLGRGHHVGRDPILSLDGGQSFLEVFNPLYGKAQTSSFITKECSLFEELFSPHNTC